MTLDLDRPIDFLGLSVGIEFPLPLCFEQFDLGNVPTLSAAMNPRGAGTLIAAVIPYFRNCIFALASA